MNKLRNERERKIFSDGMAIGIFISAVLFILIVGFKPM